ncbi:hypothetical protein LCGC14_0757590 [marine sediment metagenome]|uniref:Uncharacterized protein n=1 Tax=marine sediment metagenome TaxID=412755 RepID=A0A0F9QM22_9ZZZZ
MAKVFKNIVLDGYDGKPMKGPEDVGELYLVHVMRVILNNAPLQTQQDSINGMRLAQALDAVKNGVEAIELEEGVHDWLKPIAEKLTPALFRVNGNIVYKHICDGFEKAHQPKEKEHANE